MKLFRFGELNKEKPGVMVDNRMLDASAFGEDYTEVFFANDGLKRLELFIKKNENDLPIVTNARIGVPVVKPSKIVCIGLNYADHAKETNAPFPPSRLYF